MIYTYAETRFFFALFLKSVRTNSKRESGESQMSVKNRECTETELDKLREISTNVAQKLRKVVMLGM